MADEVYTQAIVYGAMHDDGRWYIGSTANCIDQRRHAHYAKALTFLKGQHTTHFHQALATTAETEWTWGVHEYFQDISRSDLFQKEAEYQDAFGCVGEGGFNTMRAVKTPGYQTMKSAKRRERLPIESAAYMRAYRARSSREERNSKWRKWYNENKEAVQERARLWRVAHPEAVARHKQAAKEKRAAAKENVAVPSA